MAAAVRSPRSPGPESPLMSPRSTEAGKLRRPSMRTPEMRSATASYQSYASDGRYSYASVSKEGGYGSRDALNDNDGYPRRSRAPGPGYGAAAAASAEPKRRSRRCLWLALLLLLIVAAAVAIPVGIVVSRNSSSSSSSTGGNQNQAAGATTSQRGATTAAATTMTSAAPIAPTWQLLQGPMTGGNGSTVYPMNGSATTFTYINNYGGHWSAMPFDNSAQAQADTPALNATFDYTVNTVRGVNLGGWLVLEPFIVSALFATHQNASIPVVDEWSMSEALDLIGPGEKQRVMEDHYNTFVTEDDFAAIASAGFNFIRLPIGFWAIETRAGEPFYTGAWAHVLDAIAWSRKYGLRLQFDMHGLPGSQNGWDHSGRRTFSLGFMRGPMGIPNAQRYLNQLRTLTQFIMRPEIAPVVVQLGLVNEVLILDTGMGATAARGFYAEAYRAIRNITGPAGPHLIIHDGFSGMSTWDDFMNGADRVILDSHPYLAFTTQNNDPMLEQQRRACSYGSQFRSSMRNFGLTLGGEWSLAVNDCSLYLNGIGLGTRYEGTYPTAASSTYPRVGSCDSWNDATTWSPQLRADFQTLTLAWMDSLQHFFFWTWKTQRTTTGAMANPMWCASCGIELGYFPANIPNAAGTCNALFPGGGYEAPYQGPFAAPAAAGPALPAWPPAIIGGGGNLFTATGAAFALPVPTPTAFPSAAATGAVEAAAATAAAQPTAVLPAFFVPVAGQSYPPTYNGDGVDASEGFTG